MPLAGFLDSPSTPWLTIPMADEGVRVSVEPEHSPSLVKVSSEAAGDVRRWMTTNEAVVLQADEMTRQLGGRPGADEPGKRANPWLAAVGLDAVLHCYNLGSSEGDAPGASCPPPSPAEGESRGLRVWRGTVDRRRARLGAAPRRGSFTPGRHSRRSAWIGGVVWPS
jgi:hypothetical protein